MTNSECRYIIGLVSIGYWLPRVRNPGIPTYQRFMVWIGLTRFGTFSMCTLFKLPMEASHHWMNYFWEPSRCEIKYSINILSGVYFVSLREPSRPEWTCAMFAIWGSHQAKKVNPFVYVQVFFKQSQVFPKKVTKHQQHFRYLQKSVGLCDDAEHVPSFQLGSLKNVTG